MIFFVKLSKILIKICKILISKQFSPIFLHLKCKSSLKTLKNLPNSHACLHEIIQLPTAVFTVLKRPVGSTFLRFFKENPSHGLKKATTNKNIHKKERKKIEIYYCMHDGIRRTAYTNSREREFANAKGRRRKTFLDNEGIKSKTQWDVHKLIQVQNCFSGIQI